MVPYQTFMHPIHTVCLSWVLAEHLVTLLEQENVGVLWEAALRLSPQLSPHLPWEAGVRRCLITFPCLKWSEVPGSTLLRVHLKPGMGLSAAECLVIQVAVTRLLLSPCHPWKDHRELTTLADLFADYVCHKLNVESAVSLLSKPARPGPSLSLTGLMNIHPLFGKSQNS